MKQQCLALISQGQARLFLTHTNFDFAQFPN